MNTVIAIDGPAGSGKGTIACKLAKHLSFAYLDSGILYRAFACAGINELSDFHKYFNSSDAQSIVAAAQALPESMMRSDVISMKASSLAKNYKIREKITHIIREFASTQNDKYFGIVMDGRDIGTVVFPNADCKIFMTASLDVRAKRRFESVKVNNPNITFKEIYENLKKRDEQDASRAIAPLSFNEDYITINNSDEVINVTFANVLAVVKIKLSL